MAKIESAHDCASVRRIPLKSPAPKYCEASTLTAPLIPDTMIKLKKKIRLPTPTAAVAESPSWLTIKISTTPSNENNMVCSETGKPMCNSFCQNSLSK
ncbi:hypothetical protein MED222_06920 [Vibrio sp. MED222]|nr:hypothetical protein MED222_06920 [Vibrio sp. MED222]